MIDTICVSSYDEQHQREPRILKGIEGSGAGWLIVDDLVDTGQTGNLFDPHGIRAIRPHPRVAEGDIRLPRLAPPQNVRRPGS